MGRRLTVSVLEASQKLAQVQAKTKRLKAQLARLEQEERALQPFLFDRYSTDTDIELDDGSVLEVRLRETPAFSPDLVAIQKEYEKRNQHVPYAKAIVTKVSVRKRRAKT